MNSSLSSLLDICKDPNSNVETLREWFYEVEKKIPNEEQRDEYISSEIKVQGSDTLHCLFMCIVHRKSADFLNMLLHHCGLDVLFESPEGRRSSFMEYILYDSYVGVLDTVMEQIGLENIKYYLGDEKKKRFMLLTSAMTGGVRSLKALTKYFSIEYLMEIHPGYSFVHLALAITDKYSVYEYLVSISNDDILLTKDKDGHIPLLVLLKENSNMQMNEKVMVVKHNIELHGESILWIINKEGISPLSRIIRSWNFDHFSEIRHLVDWDDRLKTMEKYKEAESSALHIAVCNPDYRMLQYISGKFSNSVLMKLVNSDCVDGMRPLYITTALNKVSEVLDLFVEIIMEIDDSGSLLLSELIHKNELTEECCIHAAIRTKNNVLLNTLLQYFAEDQIKLRYGGCNVMQVALNNMDPDIMATLLDHGGYDMLFEGGARSVVERIKKDLDLKINIEDDFGNDDIKSQVREHSEKLWNKMKEEIDKWCLINERVPVFDGSFSVIQVPPKEL